MKFGKRIKTEAIEEWGEYYVDYKELKHLLKPLIGKTQCDAEEDEFAAAIEAEIEKVDRFFTDKEAELYAEFRMLLDGQRRAHTQLCQQVSRTHLEVSDANCSSLDKLFLAHEGTPAGALIKDFLSLSTKVDSMRKYVMINTLAVVKITKKHDKHQARQLQRKMVDSVHQHHFYLSSRFGTLITDIEVLATQIMSRLTNSKPLAENYSCPICLGILCNPVVLSCGHRFCMKCVSAASYFCQTSCPVCRKEQILDLETIKVDTLLSHFLDRYFPEGQSGVKQCRTCASHRASDDTPGRQRMPCEECNIAVMESLGRMQSACISYHKEEVAAARAAAGAPEGGSLGKRSAATKAAQASKHKQSGGGGVESAAAIAPGVEDFDLEVRPRLKRRSVGQGGKQALGGRPHMDADAQAPPILLNAAMLREHFNLPLNDAAKRLGVCATAIKKVCRKIGIKQWPHRKLKAVEKRIAMLRAESAHGKGGGAAAGTAEMADLEKKRAQLLQGGDCDVSGIGGGGGSSTRREEEEEELEENLSEKVPAGGGRGSKVDLRKKEAEDGGGYGMSAPQEVAVMPTVEEGGGRMVEGESSRAGDGGVGASGGWLTGSNHCEDDVWEMLHQMMDEPATSAASVEGEDAAATGEVDVASIEGDGCGVEGMANGVLRSAETNGMHRVGTLEEEVLNLRQFTMTLIKERGELAMKIAELNATIQDLSFRNAILESERSKYRPSAAGADGGSSLDGKAPAGGEGHHEFMREAGGGGGMSSPPMSPNWMLHVHPSCGHLML